MGWESDDLGIELVLACWVSEMVLLSSYSVEERDRALASTGFLRRLQREALRKDCRLLENCQSYYALKDTQSQIED